MDCRKQWARGKDESKSSKYAASQTWTEWSAPRASWETSECPGSIWVAVVVVVVSSSLTLFLNRLIDLVAGDSAIGDTLFYLGQALHSEVIEVEKFLKQTRFLAREQFMRRALAQKITQGMGWWI
jgi:xanthine/uracil/vitamin C permease (AzgA family)